MRVVLGSCVAVWLATGSMSLAAPNDCPRPFDENEPYPTEVALLNEPPRGWTYRQSPNRLPLYYSDADRANQSNCYEGCSTQWIPLQAPDDARAVGEWTLIKRRDGRLQWAHRARPLYTRIHDSPEAPSGDGVDGKWHVLPFCP